MAVQRIDETHPIPETKMKQSGIELGNISNYRGELMGFAIIFVMLFHVGLPRNDLFFGLRRMGNIGVDMFFFLSGIGLWYSWAKDSSTHTFYLKRLFRIYPTWLIVTTAYYVPDMLWSDIVRHGGHSKNFIDLIGDITINWDFWLNGELTFWYIPATMILYLFTPAYLRLIIKHPTYRWLPALMMAWCVIVQYVTPIHDTVQHLEIFWSRIPIYFLGINMGAAVKENKRIESSAIWLILIAFIGTLAACIYLEQVKHGRFPLFLERMLYIPLTISGIIILAGLLRKTSRLIRKACFFFGSISLELYLIHHHFILIYIEPFGWSYWVKFLLVTAIALPMAWLLHKLTEAAVKPIKRRIL